MKATTFTPVLEITGEMHAFTKANIDKAPEEYGVYVLYQPGTAIYIGRADEGMTLRERLQSHLSGAEGPCTRGATAFRCEVTETPAVRQKELAEAWTRAHNGKLPRCNG